MWHGYDLDHVWIMAMEVANSTGRPGGVPNYVQ